jgi:hypothetical protein
MFINGLDPTSNFPNLEEDLLPDFQQVQICMMVEAMIPFLN